jgi:hypothetical protein
VRFFAIRNFDYVGLTLFWQDAKMSGATWHRDVCLVMQYIPHVLVGVCIWLLVLSVVSFWIFRYFHRLSKQVGKGNLVQVLEKVLKDQKESARSIKKIAGQIENIIEDGSWHIQKLGLVRFNPFKEMGGDHSFSLALLDGKDKGIIITGLHTRERTRVYVKEIEDGKSKLGLAKEEEKALKLACKSKRHRR